MTQGTVESPYRDPARIPSEWVGGAGGNLLFDRPGKAGRTSCLSSHWRQPGATGTGRTPALPFRGLWSRHYDETNPNPKISSVVIATSCEITASRDSTKRTQMCQTPATPSPSQSGLVQLFFLGLQSMNSATPCTASPLAALVRARTSLRRNEPKSKNIKQRDCNELRKNTCVQFDKTNPNVDCGFGGRAAQKGRLI